MDLNPEQQKLVEAEPGGHTLIRGVAGSGKTTVALHRTLFLLRNYCIEENDRVLLATFNRTLINYLRQILGRLKGTDYYRNIFSGDDRAIDVKTVDSLIAGYNPDKGKKIEFATSNMKLSLLKESIVDLKKSADHPVLNYKNDSFLLNEIEWVKSCKYMELEEYQNVDRIGRQSFEEGEGPQRLPKNSPARRAIYELMLVYTRMLADRGYVDFLDRALYALNNADIKEEEKYSHIIVDEAQDLTRVQWEFLKRLYALKKYSSFTVVMDTAQSIYPNAWMVKGRSFTSIGLDMTGKSHILSKSYRNTWQIARSAYSLIENDVNITGDEHYVAPAAIDKQGCDPLYCFCENERDESEYVRDKIKELLAGDYTCTDIAVIARLHNQLDYLQECFNEAGLPCYRSKKYDSPLNEKAINLLTLHAIKGLEFKVVFIIGLNERVMPYLPYQVEHVECKLLESNERKLLYVGMTRATEMLFLSSSGPPSSFITDINPEQVKSIQRTKIKDIYPVTPEVYLFKDKLLSPSWSNEEKVRQWFLKELLNTYGYPQSSIDVEYKVNSFSQTTGSVDIVVFSTEKGSPAPYIFVETKAPGSDIEAGRRQLESYMSNCRTCRYGVLTDGKKMLVINQDFAEIDDIPCHEPSSPPSSIEHYFYTEVRAPRGHHFIVDGASPEVVIEKTEEEEIEYGSSELIKVPVFQSIAAGAPGFMNEQAEDHFSLPREWVKESDRLFMLKVEGDSMEGVDIIDGDYVLVSKQDSVDNTDIVVAAIEDDATLKEYMKIDGQVMLIPKNKKYKPIKVQSEQARVLGKVIGIVKPQSPSIL